MATCDCNHDKHWYKGPFGDRNYNPMHHHHPHPAPFMVDKCAEQCDDQLPLFSQVGRGLEGSGYEVVVQKDSLAETILEGMFYDPHTGAYTSDWISKNINGGHLSYQYNLRPFTDPQTFTITFKYVRPGRNADENGTVWSWTTPAIPYLWSRQPGGSMSDGEDIVGTGVATLYLKKTTDGAWDWRQHEKLVYPDGFTHEDMNAPDPLEGWTVNLTYGIGGDIDAPNIDDIAKIIGITPDNIRQLVQGSLPTETFPDGMNTKQYIDSFAEKVKQYDVKSSKPGSLGVSSATVDKKTTFTLTPVAPSAGDGIKITEDSSGKVTITNKIVAGPGIKINKKSDGTMQIVNTSVAPDFNKLIYGEDFEIACYNGWYFGQRASGSSQPDAPSDRQYPDVYAVVNYDNDHSITNATIKVQQSISGERCFVNELDIKSVSNFKFHHADPAEDIQESHLFGINFIGDYAPLNNLKIANVNNNGSIWNVFGTNDNPKSGNARFYSCGASWSPNLSVNKLSAQSDMRFLVAAASIPDGYNEQYGTPNYGYDHLVIRPWANLVLSFDLI